MSDNQHFTVYLELVAVHDSQPIDANLITQHARRTTQTNHTYRIAAVVILSGYDAM
jgi:hypothetical protein